MADKEIETAGEHYDAVVVGAGVAGLYQLYKLKQTGLSVILLETGTGVGGVWYWNRYPGARLDSESYTYAYFFSEEILKEWQWSEEFVGQPELERYYNFVVDKLDLRRHIRFSTRLDSARFDPAARVWNLGLEMQDGSAAPKMSCRFLLPALGILSAVNYPNIPGAETFQGTMLHTGLWPKQDPVLKDKRVAVVGTGSSGVQLITQIASEVNHLYVFQRTPNWVLPLNNKPITEERAKELACSQKAIYERLLAAPNGYIHTEALQKGGDLTEEERRAFFDGLWKDAGLRFFSGNFKDLITNKAVNDSLNRYLAEKIRARIKDPKLAERLIPVDHGFGTKRPPLDSGYYEVYNRDNVTLIDSRDERIRRFSPNGIVTDGGEYEVDVIVIATGFDALTGAFERVDIRGLHGKNLKEHWAQGARTYISMFCEGFPNLFLVNGPQGPTGNNPRTTEFQVNFITDCIEYMVRNGYTRVETTAAAEEKWTERIIKGAKGTLLDGNQTTWLLGTNVEGKVRAPLQLLEGSRAFRKHCHDLQAEGYPGLNFG